MNLDRFEEFKRKSQLLIVSSKWLCCEIDKAIEKFINLPEDTPYDQLDNMLDNMNNLQMRSIWEDTQHKKLIEEYKDIIHNES